MRKSLRTIKTQMPVITGCNYSFNYKGIDYILSFVNIKKVNRSSTYKVTLTINNGDKNAAPTIVDLGKYLASNRIFEYYEAEKILGDYLGIEDEYF